MGHKKKQKKIYTQKKMFKFVLLFLALCTVTVFAQTRCSPGYYSSNGYEPCCPCFPGTYASVYGSTTCPPCDAGYYGNGYALTACTPCANGTYAQDVGEMLCSDCPPGSSCAIDPSSGNGAVAAPLCPPGTYAPQKSTSCTLCPAGTFNTIAGAAACQSCPMGTFS